MVAVGCMRDNYVHDGAWWSTTKMPLEKVYSELKSSSRSEGISKSYKNSNSKIGNAYVNK